MLPIGKIPPELLEKIFLGQPEHPELILGPGIGLDCAVIDVGDRLLALKSDPITFVTEAIGWYAVQVNANDIATVGGRPRWFLPTLLLPENETNAELVEGIMEQVRRACSKLGILLVGGHTEVTHGLDRPLLAGMMIGELSREELVTPRGAQPGDTLLLTKGVPIEGTVILAREFEHQLRGDLGAGEIQLAKDFLFSPGISVVRDSQLACQAGRVHAMHDPTEGGIAAALWELAAASGRTMLIDPHLIPVPQVSNKICRLFELDPLASIASGALLLSVHPEDAQQIGGALKRGGIPCAAIGRVEAGEAVVFALEEGKRRPFPRPQRDEIAKLFDG